MASRSPWNAALEQVLNIASEKGLTASALRLHLALLRYTLGWNRREARIGRRLLCDLSGLNGRTFERARAELVDAGLITVVHGVNEGPHTRALYILEPPSGVTQTPVNPDANPRHESGHAFRQSSKKEQGVTPVRFDRGLACPVCGIEKRTRQQLVEHLENVHGIYEAA